MCLNSQQRVCIIENCLIIMRVYVLTITIQEGGFESVNLRKGEVTIEKKVAGETCGTYVVDTEFKPSTMICGTNVAPSAKGKLKLSRTV